MAAVLSLLNATLERLHFQLSNPDGYTIGKVMRVDVNGTRTVRMLVNQLPSTAALIDIYDYEYALLFDARVDYYVYDAANNVVASTSWSNNGPPFGEYEHRLQFACPLYPSNGVTLADGGPVSSDPSASFAITWTGSRASRTTLHAVINRPDPVPVLRLSATRAGDLTVICPDQATCELIEAQLALPYMFMLRQSDVAGLDMYFAVQSLAASNVPDSRRWQLVIGLSEVAWPPGGYVPPSTWTYADVMLTYGDYNAVAASFLSYADLTDKLPSP